MHAEEISTAVFALGPHVRYVAIANGQLRQRSGLTAASSSESDRYEELLVNPALLLLARQRGDLDRGGMRYVIVRYGNFTQVVVPSPVGGHISVGVELGHDPVDVGEAVTRLLG